MKTPDSKRIRRLVFINDIKPILGLLNNAWPIFSPVLWSDTQIAVHVFEAGSIIAFPLFKFCISGNDVVVFIERSDCVAYRGALGAEDNVRAFGATGLRIYNKHPLVAALVKDYLIERMLAPSGLWETEEVRRAITCSIG